MKTSIKQLIEKLEDAKSKCETLRDVIYFDGVLAIIEAGKFEELHEKEIHDAYKAGWWRGFAVYQRERKGVLINYRLKEPKT